MLYGSTSSQPVSRIPKACLRLQVSEPGTEEAFQGESLTSVQRSCDISRSLGWSIRLELTSLALQGGVIDIGRRSNAAQVGVNIGKALVYRIGPLSKEQEMCAFVSISRYSRRNWAGLGLGSGSGFHGHEAVMPRALS
jgi:hypothetical protein